MNKVGSFFQSFLPFILYIAVQVVVNIVVMIVYTIRSLTSDDGVGLMVFLEELPADAGYIQMVSVIFGVIVLIGFTIWYRICFVRPIRKKTRKYWSGISFQVIIALVFLAFGLQYVAQLITGGIGHAFPTLMDNYNQLMSDAGFDSMTVMLFIYTILLAPIVEELTFRGLTMRFARQWMPFWAANIFQAFLFGVIHLNVIQGIYAFCLGLFFGWVAKTSHSIKQSIILHIIFNFLGSICIGFFDITLSFNAYVFYGIGVALTIFALIIYGREFSEKNMRHKQRYQPEVEEEPDTPELDVIE